MVMVCQSARGVDKDFEWVENLIGRKRTCVVPTVWNSPTSSGGQPSLFNIW